MQACSRSFAAERTRLLIGCYRRDEAADPEVYVSSVASVFLHYPEEVVKRVTDPFHGLPAYSLYLPKLAEVRAACEREMKPRYEALERERRLEEQRRLLAAPEPAPAEVREEAVAKWEAQRDEMLGRKSAEQVREEAEKRLMELSAESISWKPPAVSDELRARFEAYNREREAR